VLAVLWRVGLVAGVLLVAVGGYGLWTAGRGLQSESVRVAGVPVEMVHGTDAPARGPAVVVAHGYAGSGRLMRPFADTLARRGYVVALPDLAGHAANPRPYTDIADAVRDLESVVRYVRGLPDVDPDRVALLGHSMGASAVVRAGAADQRIAATVAISLGDDEAAALRPGPRNLLLIRGGLEPAGMAAVADRALANTDHGSQLAVPFVEHVSVLFADTTHRRAARWIDDAVSHRPALAAVEAHRRVAAGGLLLLGSVLLVAAVVVGSRRGVPVTPPGPPLPSGRTQLIWLAGGVAVSPVVGLVLGVAGALVLPAVVTGYLVGYFLGAGVALAMAALVVRGRSALVPQWTVHAVGLAVAGCAAVVVPVQLGLTTMLAHGAVRWGMVTLLALATAVLLAGAHAVVRLPWAVAVLAVVGLPLPVAAVVNLAPGFLVVVTPLIAGLFAVYLVLAAMARRAGWPAWCAIPAGALVVAWPVAATLPLT